MTVILASASAARARMLRDAGLVIEPLPPMVDEAAIRDGLRAEGADARAVADALAEAKAVKVSRRLMGAGDGGAGGLLVLGADQTLALDDGTMFDKPASPADAMAQLGRMAGGTHRLFSAAVVAEGGQPIWRHIGVARLTLRPLSEAYIADHVGRYWDDIEACVGCYRVEAEGALLFSAVDGDPWTIQGLPLLPLLAWLRTRGILPS